MFQVSEVGDKGGDPGIDRRSFSFVEQGGRAGRTPCVVQAGRAVASEAGAQPSPGLPDGLGDPLWPGAWPGHCSPLCEGQTPSSLAPARAQGGESRGFLSAHVPIPVPSCPCGPTTEGPVVQASDAQTPHSSHRDDDRSEVRVKKIRSGGSRDRNEHLCLQKDTCRAWPPWKGPRWGRPTCANTRRCLGSGGPILGRGPLCLVLADLLLGSALEAGMEGSGSQDCHQGKPSHVPLWPITMTDRADNCRGSSAPEQLKVSWEGMGWVSPAFELPDPSYPSEWKR